MRTRYKTVKVTLLFKIIRRKILQKQQQIYCTYNLSLIKKNKIAITLYFHWKHGKVEEKKN
jgi:hypothetical protein